MCWRETKPMPRGCERGGRGVSARAAQTVTHADVAWYNFLHVPHPTFHMPHSAFHNHSQSQSSPTHVVIGMAGYDLTHDFFPEMLPYFEYRTDKHWGCVRQDLHNSIVSAIHCALIWQHRQTCKLPVCRCCRRGAHNLADAGRAV